jgi:hypothetical protein
MKDTQQFTRYSANVLLEAAAIQEKKGQDYQNPLSRVRQVDHYPRGVHSILDTVNGKVLRMVSVLETMEAGGKVNFESVEDSALDAINYLSFIVAYMRGEIDGQDGTKDIFNRRMSKATHPTTALIPEKFKPQTSGTITVGMTAGATLNTVGYGIGKAVWPMKEGARGTTE